MCIYFVVFLYAITWGWLEISYSISNVSISISGYMAPEYAMDGLFSVKSDVFSFGVLLLEIVCGKRNSGSFRYEHGQSLLSFVSSYHFLCL